MAIGDMKAIKLYQWAATRNTDGDFQEDLVARYRCWAEVSDGGGGRSHEHGKTLMAETKSFKIHFRKDWTLDGNWQLKYYGRTYSITRIERINEKRFNWLVTAQVK